MILRLFKLTALSAALCFPLAGCEVEDNTPDSTIETPDIELPETDEPEVDIDTPGGGVEVDTDE